MHALNDIATKVVIEAISKECFSVGKG